MLDHISNRIQASLLDNNRLTVRISPHDLTPLLKEVVSLHRFAARERKQKIVLDAPNSIQALVDPLRIREVFDQLISNAIRFSPSGTRITVRLMSTPSAVRIQVEDEGRGMGWMEQQSLFSSQMGTLDRHDRRFGLGLIIAKRLIDLHQGRIWAYSPGTGKGSTFYVELRGQAAQS
ncbi:MAG: ATP-binding protein [Bacteroidetes bacterium]|nr:MAG: ATP-binding protein [Bacteroidota bacterium]